jgi:CcmD family protein
MPHRTRRPVATLVTAILLTATVSLFGRSAALAVSSGLSQPRQEEFVPVSELPPDEQLPAAPLLIAAYAIVWVALMIYLWSIWRRLGRVERELSALAVKSGSHPGRSSHA